MAEKRHTKWERSSEEINNRCPRCKCKLGYLHYYNYEDGTSSVRSKCGACGSSFSIDVDYRASGDRLKKIFIESLSDWRKRLSTDEALNKKEN